MSTPEPIGEPDAPWDSVLLTDCFSGDTLVDLTDKLLGLGVSTRLNRPLAVTLHLPAWDEELQEEADDGLRNLAVGVRAIKAYRRGVLVAHVLVWTCSWDFDADVAKVRVDAYDPMVQLRRRPARDDTGDFSDPEFPDEAGAGAVIKGIIENTISWEGDLLIEPDGGTCDAAIDVGGNYGNWPVMIDDLLQMFVRTGAVDIVFTPLDDTPGKLVTLNVVDAGGVDRSETVSFTYGATPHSVASGRYVEDMEEFCNKLWYYLGPKVSKQRWRGNITGRDEGSVAIYGVYMDIRIYDTGQENSERALFTQLRAEELRLRKVPERIVSFTPQAGNAAEPFTDYGVGDLVTVNLDAASGAPLTSGVVRVHGFDVSVGADGVERVTNLVLAEDPS